MAGKKKDIEIPEMELDTDGLPSDAELDALQQAIDREMDGVAHAKMRARPKKRR